jgi:hypothetical protein
MKNKKLKIEQRIALVEEMTIEQVLVTKLYIEANVFDNNVLDEDLKNEYILILSSLNRKINRQGMENLKKTGLKPIWL